MSSFLRISARTIGIGVACLIVTACSNSPTGRVASTASIESKTASDIDAVVSFLEQGEVQAAKKRIASGLKRDPQNPSLMMLRDSITLKPQDLLGPESYSYTARSGDTMAGLAHRFLGNRLKFYQLSRYNGMDRPSTLTAGQVLNIPGRAPAAPPQRVERRLAPVQPPVRARPKAAAVAAVPVRAADPAAASQARSAGLSALNAGRPSKAVSLLGRAARLDPGNAAIARELARARRIAATVGTK